MCKWVVGNVDDLVQNTNAIVSSKQMTFQKVNTLGLDRSPHPPDWRLITLASQALGG